VRNHVAVNIVLMFTVVSGAIAAFRMIREVMPQFSVDMILVTVPYPGAGPEEVEEGICLKIEDAIEGVEGIKRYSTVSAENVASAVVEVREDAVVQKVKDDVTDRINAISTFPADAERPIVTELTTRNDVMHIALFGPASERQLKELADAMQIELTRLPHVSQVSVSGTRPYEISIEVSEEKLRAYGLTLGRVTDLVRAAAQNWPGGTMRAHEESIGIRTMGRKYSGEEYANIVLLARPDGTSIRLGQVATVRDGFVEDRVIGTFNGQPSVQIQIFKTNEEDALAIADEVRAYVARKALELPPTIHLQIWSDWTRFITERLDLLLRNGRIGLGLVFLLLWLFLDLRLAFWVSMGIPVSLAGALALMGAQGQTINMISLFALIMLLGIIVDDAIVVGEAIYVHRKQGQSPEHAAIEGTAEVAWPVFASVATTVVAFVPLLFVGGIMGKFIRVLPEAVIVALAASLAECLFGLPVHLRRLPAERPRAEPRWGALRVARRVRRYFNHGVERFGEKVYRPSILRLLDWRYVTAAAFIAVLMLAIGLYRGGFVRFQMFPDIDTDFLMARVEFPDGTPVETTRQALKQLEDGLGRVVEQTPTESGDPLIESLYSVAGAQSGYDATQAANLGEILVELLPTERRHVYFRDIVSRWEREAGPIPGALSVTLGAADGGGPPGRPIEVWLLGDDLDRMRRAADELKTHLASYVGVSQISDDFRQGKRELRARLKPEARNLGLTPEDLGRQLREGYFGGEAVRIQRGQDDLRVKVRYPLDERRSLADLESIRIRTPDGSQVPLRTVADLSMELGYSSIRRQDGVRRISVTADVDAEVANSREIAADLETRYLPELGERYPGLYVSLEGEKRNSAESLQSLVVGFPLGMLAIFLIIASMFKSYAQPLTIMITIPFGLIGAMFGHLLLGFDVTMLSLFGMVAVAGMVVNDAIVLIDAINARMAEGLPIRQAISEGGARRFRAILLTTLTTVFGLMPLILEKSMQAQFLIPMALSVAAGVAFATLLTLIFIPCQLMILSDGRRLAAWLRRGVWADRETLEPAHARAGDFGRSMDWEHAGGK
jgi:multidrug efflux pump subunit AcrB